MGNKKYIEEFENYNRSKGLASATIEHQTKLMRLVTQQIKKDFNTLTKTDIENYLLYLQNKGYAKASMEQTKIIIM